ncbi:pimeloyl-ACP methyl ester esterase BioH [Methylomonas sp. AM2-LC]|uniref:pimeloyl-ACP methyl ester esterase BioH n=1 Tax=Methylomonas sp. AM2-LC TaxID=3153301 RepID=UPI0032652079
MTTLNIQVFGQGQAVVLVHGWGMHTGVWLGFAQQLAADYQVICVDLPGHGSSDKLVSYSLDSMSQALLAAIPVEKFIVLGWSLGATLAIAMAERSPQRVDALFILAGNPCFVQTADWPGVLPDILDAFIEQLAVNAQVTQQRFLALQVYGQTNCRQLLQTLKQQLQLAQSPDIEALTAGLQILKQSDLRSALMHINCPVIVILGAEDKLIPQATLQALQQIMPQIKLHSIENAGHVPFLTHNEQLLALLRAAL